MALSLLAVAGIVLALWAVSKLLRAALQLVQGLLIAYAALWLLQRAGVLQGWQPGWDWTSLQGWAQGLYGVAGTLFAYVRAILEAWR